MRARIWKGLVGLVHRLADIFICGSSRSPRKRQLQFDMVPPVEHADVVPNRRFTQKIRAVWQDGHGPQHFGEDYLPIDECVLIRQRIEEQIATGSTFSLMVNAAWRGEGAHMGDEKFHVQLPKFNIGPASMEGEAYTYPNVLRMLKRAYAAEMMERTTGGSRLHYGELSDVVVQIAPNVVQNEALARNTFLTLNGATYVKLPLFISAKKATLNIQNRDTQCFRGCMIAWKMFYTEDGFVIPDHAERWNNYLMPECQRQGGRYPQNYRPKYLEVDLDFSSLPYDRAPSPEEMAAFEKDNCVGVYIWVWFAGNASTSVKAGAKRARGEEFVQGSSLFGVLSCLNRPVYW